MAVESAIALSMRKTAVAALKENRENIFSDLLKITTFLLFTHRIWEIPDLWFSARFLSTCWFTKGSYTQFYSYTCGIAKSSPTIVFDKKTIPTFF